MSVQVIRELVPNSMTVAIAVISVILVTVGTAIFKRIQYVRFCEKVPGPRAEIPFIGSFTEWMGIKPEDIASIFINISNTWNKHSITRFWIGPMPAFMVASAEGAEVVLSSNKLIDKSREYDFLHPWLATGLLTSTGSKWQKRRKMLTPAFHFKILEDFVQVFNEQSNVLVDKLHQQIEKKKEFDIFPFITLATLDVICETAMGRNVNAQNESESSYVKAVYEMSDIVVERMIVPWLQLDFLFHLFPQGAAQKRSLSILHDFSDRVIRERKEEYKRRKALEEKKSDLTKPEDNDFMTKKSRLAFLDLLIEASQDGQVLSDLDIREEVDTFMFEGHDTTAAAIVWSFFLIGSNPSAQEQLSEELSRVFSDDVNRPITMSDLAELKYLECCIKEALRLYPSVPGIGRTFPENTMISGFEIPSGASILVSPFLIHRDPKNFPDPEKFQPERFFPENSRKRHPYAYVPFSAGPRNCIGQKFALMEEKIVLASVLRRFHVESLEKPEDIPLISQLVLRPRDGIRLRMTPK